MTRDTRRKICLALKLGTAASDSELLRAATALRCTLGRVAAAQFAAHARPTTVERFSQQAAPARKPKRMKSAFGYSEAELLRARAYLEGLDA